MIVCGAGKINPHKHQINEVKFDRIGIVPFHEGIEPTDQLRRILSGTKITDPFLPKRAEFIIS